jgi:hypothetical protein
VNLKIYMYVMSMFVPCFIKEKQGNIIGVICEAVGIVF